MPDPLARRNLQHHSQVKTESSLMHRFYIAIAALLIAGCATAPQDETAASQDCFRGEHVSTYSVIDNTHIGISVGANRNYVLTTMWNARDLDWTQAIAIRSSSGWICTGNGLGVELIGGDPQRTYPIVSIERAPGDDQAVQGS
jgi:hypothetical protein